MRLREARWWMLLVPVAWLIWRTYSKRNLRRLNPDWRIRYVGGS